MDKNLRRDDPIKDLRVDGFIDFKSVSEDCSNVEVIFLERESIKLTLDTFGADLSVKLKKQPLGE